MKNEDFHELERRVTSLEVKRDEDGCAMVVIVVLLAAVIVFLAIFTHRDRIRWLFGYDLPTVESSAEGVHLCAGHRDDECLEEGCDCKEWKESP